MVFTLSTSKYFYPNEKERNRLEKLGFSFKSSDYKDFMIVGHPTVEINTVEELVKFAEEYDNIIIDADGPEIQICDRDWEGTEGS